MRLETDFFFTDFNPSENRMKRRALNLVHTCLGKQLEKMWFHDHVCDSPHVRDQTQKVPQALKKQTV